MFERATPFAAGIWRRFRSYPTFVQLLLVIPVISAIALTVLVGNMGLALMGTAIAINSVFAGWIGGAFVLILARAGMIVVKERNTKD